MLKTGFKSFVYSFSVSLFAIVSANKMFFYEKKEPPYDLNIQNKTIALYLADTNPSHVPVKKIALSSLPELPKKQQPEPLITEPEVIIASTLEPLDIPLEFIEKSPEKAEPIVSKKQEIILADILYAPDKPLPMPEIKAEPIYQPKENVEIKIAAAPLYTPEKNEIAEVSPSPQVIKKQTKNEDNYLILAKNKPADKTPSAQKEKKKDNSLVLARNETIGTIPLSKTAENKGINKIHMGDPKDLQHIALADTNITIQSMSQNSATSKDAPATDTKEWKQMNDSPWVIAKSSGSKNLFADKTYTNKTKEDIKELIPLQKNKKGVMLASETAKNLIIPIPEDILNKKDIAPQLAYPETSDDKLKEINITAKIQENERLKASTKEAKKQEEILTPIEENADAAQFQTPVDPSKLKQAQESAPVKQTNEGLMNALTSFFNKTAKTASDAKNAVVEKAKSIKTAKDRKKSKSRPVTILPTEIRLSFQPNRAEISGQTLRWIQAFATKTAQTPNLALEIRIDGTSSTSLQQKRLNLLYNILTNKGVDYSTINTVFTNRDPNSFILRTVSLKNNNNEKLNNQKTNKYIQW